MRLHADHFAVGAEPVLVAAHLGVEAAEGFDHGGMPGQAQTHRLEKLNLDAARALLVRRAGGGLFGARGLLRTGGAHSSSR